MFITNTIFKISGDFGAVIPSVRAVPSHCRFFVLSYIFVSKLESYDDFALQESFFELALEKAVHILKGACTMEFAIFEFTLVVESGLRGPLVEALAAELAVFELALVVIAIM